MPYLYQKKSRRQFIKVMAGGAGAVMAMGLLPSFTVAGKKKGLRLNLMSDTHISEDKETVYRGFYPYRNLLKGVPQIKGTPADLAVITGDLARLEGKPGDYQTLKKLLDPVAGEMPVAMTMGNHDVRDHFLSVFPDAVGTRAEVPGKYIQVIEFPEIRLILLDSLVFTNQEPCLGFLGKAQRDWLDTWLGDHPDKPTFLFLHHTLDDGDGSLADNDKLFRIATPHKHVKAIFFGHSHVYAYDVHEDIHLINLPAMGYNFREQDPVGWVEATLTPGHGTFILHAVGGNMQKDGSRKELSWR